MEIVLNLPSSPKLAIYQVHFDLLEWDFFHFSVPLGQIK